MILGVILHKLSPLYVITAVNKAFYNIRMEAHSHENILQLGKERRIFQTNLFLSLPPL